MDHFNDVLCWNWVCLLTLLSKTTHFSFFMVALWNRADHYIFMLWFVLSSSFFFSSPNLSRRRLDVGHTTTHGVALVRITMQVWNLLHAARWKHRTQKVAKNRHLGTIAQLCRPISSQLWHVSTIGKNLIKQQYVLHMSPQYGELRPPSGGDRFTSLGYPWKFQRVLRLGSITARHIAVGVSQTLRCWTEGATPIFGRATITLGIGPHF